MSRQDKLHIVEYKYLPNKYYAGFFVKNSYGFWKRNIEFLDHHFFFTATLLVLLWVVLANFVINSYKRIVFVFNVLFKQGNDKKEHYKFHNVFHNSEERELGVLYFGLEFDENWSHYGFTRALQSKIGFSDNSLYDQHYELKKRYCFSNDFSFRADYS